MLGQTDRIEVHHSSMSNLSRNCRWIAFSLTCLTALIATGAKPTIASSDLPQTNPVASELPQLTAQATRRQVRVFFPVQGQNLDTVRPVWRTTTSEGVARFAVNQLISGPTTQERQTGLTQAVRLQGRSNCQGDDFTLAIQQGTARLRFCRDVVSAGVGDDARASSAIRATLQQFSSVRSVVVLDAAGNCLGDQSGMNLCLRSNS
jgi:hypothetical protein